jgi:hypothetical protein
MLEADLKGDENNFVDEIDKIRLEKSKNFKDKLIQRNKVNADKIQSHVDKFKNRSFR